MNLIQFENELNTFQCVRKEFVACAACKRYPLSERLSGHCHFDETTQAPNEATALGVKKMYLIKNLFLLSGSRAGHRENGFLLFPNLTTTAILKGR